MAWTPLEEEAPARVRGPWLLGAARFVGRAREFDALRARLDDAFFGRGGIVAVGGEAGIGKTRLAHEFAAHARSHDVPILWGRCYEGDWAPPYAPWVEALSTAIKTFAPEGVAEALGGGGPTLAQLVPDLRSLMPEIAEPAPLSPGDERYRLFDAAVEFLLRLAAHRPTVLVLDDLHWADQSSLGLLGHLGRFVGNSSLLVIGTYRDSELRRGHPLDDLLANLRRERSFLRLRLRGLSKPDVLSLLTAASHRALPPSLAGAIQDETNGNPFFIEELLRHLIEEGKLSDCFDCDDAPGLRELGIPEGVRQVVRRRLERLSTSTNRMLSHAVVFTGGFDFAVLRALTGQDEEELLDALDEALAAHLIEPVAGAAETYDFVHAIVRHTLYEEWSPSRRVRLHRKLADALEAVAAGHDPERAGELAAQYALSATLPGAERGIGYALTAADQARRTFSGDRVVTFLRMARDLAEDADAPTRAEILTRLAVAEADALALLEARATVEEALAALVEATASPAEIASFLARAAAALKDGGALASSWMPFVERGLAIVPPEERLTWARLTLLIERFERVASGLVNASRWLGTDPAAVAIARQHGDEDDFARTLQPFESWSREWTGEMLARARSWQRPAAIVRALIIGGADWLYHQGDLRRAVDLFQELLVAAERYGTILGQAEGHIRLAIAQTALGDLTAAQDNEARGRELVVRLGPDHRLHASVAWFAALQAEYLGGDWAAIGSFWTRVVGDPRLAERTIGLDDAGLAALAMVRANKPAEARRLLEALAPVVATMDPSVWLLNGAVAFGGAAIWTLAAADLAPPFRAAAEGLIAAGHGDYPCGSHHLTIARLAALTGDHAGAQAAFAQARKTLDASGQRPLRAIVDFDEALALARAARPDAERREHLLQAALGQFRELGMTPWTGRAGAALDQAVRAGAEPRRDAARPAGLTDRELEVVRLVIRGQSDRQISDELYVSPRTVNAHIRNILAKTDCANRTELSVWAVEHGAMVD